MAEGQRTRKIGSGMKPCGNKRVKPQKETENMAEQSTNEGHEAPAKEAILEPQEGNETPPNLEAEKEAESFQNLESSEADSNSYLADNTGLEAVLEHEEGNTP
jgi:hypothetical protein